MNHQRTSVLLVVVAGTLLVGSMVATPVRAQEPFDEILEALQAEGYGELSVAYLNQIKERPSLPEEFKTVWNLEMASSLQLASKETKNRDLEQKYLVDAQGFLDAFLKDHGTHTEAAKAYLTSGLISLQRSDWLFSKASREKDKAKRDTMMTEVRTLIAEARPKFEKSATLFREQIDNLESGKSKATTKRARRQAAALANGWYTARHQVAVTDFNSGMSFAEPTDPKRKEFLKKAAEGFDKIYQEDRGGVIGVLNHMWEGRAREELGEYVLATDIYDEVMSAQPKQNDPKMAQWIEVFHNVNRLRLMLLGKTKNYEKLIDDAELWLKQNEAQKKTIGYQGIRLELAKAYLEMAKKQTGNDATKLAAEAKHHLGLLVKFERDNEFKKEAILLMRTAAGGEQAPLASFDEATALANAAVKAAIEADTPAEAKENWQQARTALEKGLEFSATVKEKEKNRILEARYTLAHVLLSLGEPVPSHDMALALAKDESNPKAAAAGALAVNAALAAYGLAKDKDALDRVTQVTDFMTTKFAKYAEADDARIAQGKLRLFQGDNKGAIDVFKSVNPASDRYPGALQLAAATYWTMYNEAKRKQGGQQEATALRSQAKTLIDQSVAAFEKGGQPAARQEARLLLAEMYLEENKTAEALPILEPLFDDLKSKSAIPKDRVSLRILIYAMKTFIAEGKQPRAVEVGELLMASGDDNPQINSALIEYAGVVFDAWKRANNEATAAEISKDEGRIKNAKLAEETARAAITKVLEQIQSRKQLDLGAMFFLAEKSGDLGMNDKAREQLQAITDRAASDPIFAKTAAKSMIRIRTQLIGLLRSEGKFEDALSQIDSVLKEQPDGLDPLMEKGNILQKLGESDAKRNEEAIEHWTKIRQKIEKSPGKKPKEYYETIYNCADCLRRSKKPEQNGQALQLLKRTLALSPELDGPDRVALYQTLIKEIPAPPTAAKAGAGATTKGAPTTKPTTKKK